MPALVVIGVLAGVVCLVFFIINVVRKKRIRWWLVGGGASLLVFIIGVVGSCAQALGPSTSVTSSSNPAAVQTAAQAAPSVVVTIDQIIADCNNEIAFDLKYKKMGPAHSKDRLEVGDSSRYKPIHERPG